MDRKDVTPKPKKNSNGLIKRFGIGLVGGLVGAAVIFGCYYALSGGSSSTSTGSASGSKTAGSETVSNVKVSVDSDITSAVTKVQDAVVSVVNLQSADTDSDTYGLFGQAEESSSSSADKSNLEEASSGSGVIYKVEDNTAYIVTNNHVVEGQEGLEVLLADGSKVEASLVGTDSYTDLAVLKVKSSKVADIKAATFGDSTSLKVGEPAIAIGSPLGTDYANSVTSGIVSSVNRQVTSTNDDNQTVSINAIQTDAAINPGNSGGPLVNIEGQVIGINSSKIASTAETSSSDVSVEGMGFAIPSNDVVTIINQLETAGSVTRPALGISMVDLTSLTTTQQSQYLKIPSSLTNGVVVAAVTDDTPASKAGLKEYDVITKIGDTTVESYTDLQSELYKHAVGDTITITYYRGTSKKTASVKLTMDSSELQTTTSSSTSTTQENQYGQ